MRNSVTSGTCCQSKKCTLPYQPSPSLCPCGCHRRLFGRKKTPGLRNHGKWSALPRCCRSEGATACGGHLYYRDCKYFGDPGISDFTDYTPVHCHLPGRYHRSGNPWEFSREIYIIPHQKFVQIEGMILSTIKKARPVKQHRPCTYFR